MTILREVHLSKPVALWLRFRGYTVYSEIPYHGRCIDLVGKARFTIAVELKMNLSKKVIHQALVNQSAVHFSYCAVPTNPKPIGIATCKQFGIGILVVKGRSVKVILKPKIKKPFAGGIKLEHFRPCDIGGKPHMKGECPAKTVFKILRAFRKRYPDIKWKDLYNEIPNHYRSHGSMYGAMRVIEDAGYTKRLNNEEKWSKHNE